MCSSHRASRNGKRKGERQMQAQERKHDDPLGPIVEDITNDIFLLLMKTYKTTITDLISTLAATQNGHRQVKISKEQLKCYSRIASATSYQRIISSGGWFWWPEKMRERERERERDIDRDRDRETEKQRQRQREKRVGRVTSRAEIGR